MGQPGMRVTVDAAMRARDVSRPWSEAADPADRVDGPDDDGRREQRSKGERRRLGKRQTRARR